MEISVVWVDVRPFLAQGRQPVLMLKRPKREGSVSAAVAAQGEFWVPNDNDGATQWQVTRSGDHVSVPINAYQTGQRALSSILLSGLEVGMRAVDSLREQIEDRPISATLALGSECTTLGPGDGYRIYVGIAIRTK